MGCVFATESLTESWKPICLQGNIILTDSAMTVLTLLRSHRDDAKGLQIMPRSVYPIVRQSPSHTEDCVRDSLSRPAASLVLPAIPRGAASEYEARRTSLICAVAAAG